LYVFLTEGKSMKSESQLHTRRQAALHLSATALGLSGLLTPASATAQAAYPNKPVRLVVPYPPGGFNDIVARLVSDRMTTRLGQTMLLDYKPGAGTNLGADLVAKAAPDGYTLFAGNSSLAVNPSLYGKLSYDPQNDLIPIGIYASTGFVMLINADLPPKNMKEFLAWAKTKGDEVTYATSGAGAINHLAGELFNSLAGTKMRNIPYRGGAAAITDLIGGRVNVHFASTAEALPLMKAGRVRGLGITNPRRLKVAEDLPAIKEFVKDYDCVLWLGLYAPKGTPPAVMDMLANNLRETMNRTDMRAQMYVRGAEATFLDANTSRALLAIDTRKWGALVKSSGATAS
jgi:tripartite-type tricarboxylate transporter receptor subunit TctC